MSKELQTSIHFLELILGNGGEMTAEGAQELYEITTGNKKVIKEHLKAVTNIMNAALKELGDEDDKEN